MYYTTNGVSLIAKVGITKVLNLNWLSKFTTVKNQLCNDKLNISF